jgi:hypothetical protein
LYDKKDIITEKSITQVKDRIELSYYLRDKYIDFLLFVLDNVINPRSLDSMQSKIEFSLEGENMPFDTGTIIAIAAALIFYLRLIILQRHRVKQNHNAPQKSGKRGYTPQPGF